MEKVLVVPSWYIPTIKSRVHIRHKKLKIWNLSNKLVEKFVVLFVDLKNLTYFHQHRYIFNVS